MKKVLRFATGLLAMYGIAQTQSLYVTSNDNNQILQYDAGTGAFVKVLDPTNPGLGAPTGIIFGPDGRLYVASSDNNDVLRFDSTAGTFSVFTTGGTLNEPKGLAFGPDGNLYVASSAGGNVQKFDRTTGAFISIFATGGGLTTPVGIAFGPDGNLYVTDPDNNVVLKYNGTTGAFIGTFIAAAFGGVCEPQGLVFGPDRNLYVASSGDAADGDNCGPNGNGSDAILKYDGVTGAFLGNFVTSKAGGLADPVGLTFGPDGNLYVASEDGPETPGPTRGNGQVLKFNGTTGAFISVFVPENSGGLSGPMFLAFDPNQNDYFQIRYAANLDKGDSFVNISNTGASGGNICANVYTFDPAEELISCCTCSVTPNGLQSLSVLKSLISNPLTPAIPTSTVIKIVASSGACNASTVPASNLAHGLLAWGTTLHAKPTAPVSFGVTEAPFSKSDLSAAELAHITTTCGFIQSNGSGFGICKGCAAGGLGASAPQ